MVTPRPDRQPANRSWAPVAALALAFSIILVAAAAFRLGSLTSGEPLEPILVATGEWAPYSGRDLPQNGLAAAIVSAVFQRMGFEPRYRFMPWIRTEQAALANDSNRGVRAAFPYALEQQRSAEFYYSAPILTIPLRVFFNLEKNPAAGKIETLQDLKAFTVVPISGYRYGAQLEPLVGTMKAADNVSTALRSLLTSTGPLVVIEAARVADSVLTRDLAPSAHLLRFAPLVIDSPIHLIASKRNPNNLALIRDFDRHLAALQADGSIDQIESEYTSAISAAWTVTLTPFAPGAVIEAFDAASGTGRVLLPNGTRAVVEEWSASYLKGAVEDAPSRAKVRILNGPQRGRRLYVDERTIVLMP